MRKLHWYYKFLLVFLIFFSMFFLLSENMSKIVNTSIYKNYVNFISVPFDFLSRYNIFEYKNVVEENERLSKKVIEIENDKKELENLEEDIKKLKDLLDLKKLYSDYERIYSKVINRNKMYWYNTLTIDKGSNDNVTVGSFVVTENGLVGTVNGVTKNYSTIKLITNVDKENKISVGVRTDKTFKYGTIIEYDYPYIKVELTTDKIGISKGDTLVTSGLGNLPKNIEIGEIEKIKKDSFDVGYILYVKPFQDINDINYVMVLSR